MTKYIAIFCLVASWMVPLHFLPWVSWHNEMLAFVAALLLAWAGLFQGIKRTDFEGVFLPNSVRFLSAFAAIAAIQATVGLVTFSGDALIVVFYVALCIICMTLGFFSGRKIMVLGAVPKNVLGEQTKSEIALLALALLAGACASTVAALAQVFDLWEGAGWISRMPTARRPGGNLGQPNQLATLVIMAIASLLFLFESRKVSALPAALTLFLLLAGLAVTESRTGALGFFILAIWFFVKRRTVGFKLPVWAAGMTVIAFLLLFFSWPILFGSIQMLGSETVVNTQPGSRLVVWPQLIHAVLLRPWWGWGIGRVSDAQNAVAHNYAESEAFTYSHNILLDLVIGVGVPIALAIVVAVALWLWQRIRVANQLLPWYCLALSLPVAVHSMLEFPFAYAYFLGPVMFSLGVLDGVVGSRPSLRLQFAPLASSLLITTALMALSVAEYVGIEEDFRVVRFEALRLGKTDENHRRPKVFLLTQLDALLSGGRIVPKPGMTIEELDLAKTVALRYPWTATQNRYALSLALNGNVGEAIRQMRVIRALHGEKAYDEVKSNWAALAQGKYPQLAAVALP